PDTPNSSDVSVPISGASAPRRMSSGQSGRMCRVKEVQRATLERKEEVKDLHEKEGARSIRGAFGWVSMAAVLVARPVEAVPNARGATGKSERRGSGVTASLRSGGGPARSNLARSPGPARSPTRSRPNSPEGRSGATGIKSPPRTRRKEQELLEQKALLERRIGEAQRSQVLLQRMLDEERSRGAADRAKLAALGARIDQLERTRQTGPRLFEENQTLYTELEAQSQQIDILRQQVQLLRAGHLTEPEPQLREENLRLRRDLELSRAMLSRYTEELASIMPGMQKVLQKFNHDTKPCRSLSSDIEPPMAPRTMEAAECTEAAASPPSERTCLVLCLEILEKWTHLR
ncbi:Uncharacterized protein SCF082_LOCUS35068, partial [Durusdinium trenchii]